ncbi:hypothetical protein [Streptomyces candidus]|uniref:Uncharacterized protein n=1 Tax=Streptomyces candidus TaxID=67283 RepID=A0A7X0HK84_9ACTN|nr:hypothetical protein [Streptomyces candidus]MBB6439194.1 hypothetical protein [Streptomyces candidus]GHH55243.1 hypothetical protein GCM10018773_59380 [Streptomyces candidus]
MLRPRPSRRLSRLLAPVLAAALAVPLLTAARQARPAPYGDLLTVHAPVTAPGPAPAVRIRHRAVEAHEKATGRVRWTYTRTGRRPLDVRPASGHAFTLWSDGLVTDTPRADGRPVRWHRAIPGFDGRATGVLQPLDPAAEMLAVVTPRHIAAYRTADGDLRWVLPARSGCAFSAARTVRRSRVLLVAQPCTEPAAWTDQVVPVDVLGRVTPGRLPLGNRSAGTRRNEALHRPVPGAAPGPRKGIASSR